MKNGLEKSTGIPAPVMSLRKFIGAAAATGVAGMFSPGLAPISAQGSAVQSAQFVLPKARKDVTPCKVHVPHQKPINRTFINAWEERRVVEAVKKTGRQKVVFAANERLNNSPIPHLTRPSLRKQGICIDIERTVHSKRHKQSKL